MRGSSIYGWAWSSTVSYTHLHAFLDVVTELRRLVSDESAEPSRAPADRPESPPARVKYRLKRSFDDIDRSDYRRSAYRTIREYFERNIGELNSVEGIRARIEDVGPLGFTCIILNRLVERQGQAAITLYASTKHHGFTLGDLHYSFQAHAPDNTAHGSYHIESDEYEIFLQGNSFGADTRNRKWTPDEVAHRIWEELLAKAGISYD